MMLFILLFVFFICLLYFNYYGAIGRIEKKQPNLGPVSRKEEEAFLNGTHKKLALWQAIIGSLIYTIILYLLVVIIF